MERRERNIRAFLFVVLASMAVLCAGISIHEMLSTPTTGKHNWLMDVIFLIMSAFFFLEARMALIRPYR
jgi:hypothetical protein